MSEPIKPFYDIVNSLYHLVMDPMPEAVKERDIASAFVLGFAGTYGVIRGLQWASKHVVDRLFPGYDHNVLPALEKICMAAITAVPLVYAVVDPDSAKAIMMGHPTYFSGMAGFYMGNMAGALQDLHYRTVEKAKKEHRIKVMSPNNHFKPK